MGQPRKLFKHRELQTQGTAEPCQNEHCFSLFLLLLYLRRCCGRGTDLQHSDLAPIGVLLPNSTISQSTAHFQEGGVSAVIHLLSKEKQNTLQNEKIITSAAGLATPCSSLPAARALCPAHTYSPTVLPFPTHCYAADVHFASFPPPPSSAFCRALQQGLLSLGCWLCFPELFEQMYMEGAAGTAPCCWLCRAAR